MAAPQTDAARVLIIPEAFETISRNTHEAELRDLCIAVNDPNRYLNYRNPLPGQRSWESIHCLRINSARADGMQCAEHPSLFDPTLPAGRCTNIGSQAMLMNRDEDEYLIRHLAWPICDRCRQLADNVPMLVDAKEIPYSSYLVTWFPPAPPAAPVPVLGGRHLRNRVIHPPGPPPPPPPPLPPAAMATNTRRDRDSELCDSNWTRLCVRHHNQFAAQPVPSGRFRGECECGPTYFRRWRNAANRDLHYINMKTNFAQWAQGIRDDLRPMEY